MSRPIKMTEKHMAECREAFEKMLQAGKFTDGKMNFTKTFASDTKKATVFFTAEAWAKMVMLIQNFSKEIAWHGVAQRCEDTTKHHYLISDIVVYPQEVTGASVEMDTEKYSMWLMENDEDERFNHLRMQGHSHVNMATSPSNTDLNHQEEILNLLKDDDFYIFMIWNKSFVSTNKIYDLGKNTLFENADVSVEILGASESLEDFMSGAKEMVVDKTPAKSQYPYQYGTYRGVYNSTKGSKAGKKEKETSSSKVNAGLYSSYMYEDEQIDEFDDLDDPNGPFGYRGY